MHIHDKQIEFSKRAEISIDRLSNSDKKKVIKNIFKVVELGLEPPYAAKLKGLDNTYVIRAGLDLRIIFQVCPDYIRIIDIARHEKYIQLVKKAIRGDK